MRQTKRHSLCESIINVIVGLVVALISQLIIFPVVNIHVPFSTNLLLTGYFTVISIVRSYALRRVFTSMNRPVYRSDRMYQGGLIR